MYRILLQRTHNGVKIVSTSKYPSIHSGFHRNYDLFSCNKKRKLCNRGQKKIDFAIDKKKM